MGRAKLKATNYECQVKDKTGKKCGAVLGSIQGLHAHLHHSTKHGHGQRKKGFNITPTMYKMTKKAAQDSTYNPDWGKDKTKTKKGRKPTSLKQAKKDAVIGTLNFPIILEVDFNFSSIRVGGQELDPQIIKIK